MMMNEEQYTLDYSFIGSNIKRLRAKAKISQIDLAKASNISQTHLSNIENGHTGLSFSIATKICHCLDCSLDELVYGGKEQQASPKTGRLVSECTVEELQDIIRVAFSQLMLESFGPKAETKE